MIFKIVNNTLRYLRKNKSFTIINISGLALGFACSLLIMLHVFKEHAYNSSIPDNERVFNLLQKSPDSPMGNTSISYALTPLLAGHFPEIEYFARTENYSWFKNCIVSHQPSNKPGFISFNEANFYLADTDFFQIIQYPFIEGSINNALKEPNSIVLSKETANKYFGSEPALGKTLSLNNELLFQVSGVVDIPEYVTFHFSMLSPITTVRSKSKLEGWNSNGQPFFKLKRGVNPKDFNQKVAHFYSEVIPDKIRDPEQVTLSFLPISERHLYYNRNPLLLLIFIGFVVLSISILNYVNISTSLVQKRTSEIALKKITGAGKKLIRKQFLQETSFICLLAVIFGIALAVIGIPLFRKLTGSDLLPFLNNHLKLLITSSLILWLTVTLLAGFYPALILSGIKPLTLFKIGRKKTAGIHNKNILITAQFIISIVLVIVTLMVGKQYKFMKNLPLGFEHEMVMQIPFTDQLKDNFSNLKNELKSLPAIKEVCAASSMPGGIPNHSEVAWVDDKGEKHEESFGFAIVSDGYTQTFGMNMAQGDEFTGTRKEEQKGYIINETAAKHLGFENALGNQLKFWGKEGTVIGIVTDFQNNYIFNTVKPMIISAHPKNQGFTKYLYVSLNPGDISSSIQSIEKIIKGISPDFPFEYSFTNAEIEGYIFEIKQINSTFRFASFISILLAIIGLVALTYHATQSRIKEIGIRKVNGATRIEVINLLNSNFIRWLVAAYLIACPIAWLIIFNLLKGIGNKTSIAWWTFAIAGLLVGGIALLTVSFQSWKAATRNPVEALRYE